MPATVLDALADARLLGAAFAGDGTSWAAWRTILKAAFGLPLDALDLPVFQRLTGRQTPPTTACRELWVIAGRRGGKSRMSALLGVYLGALRDPRPYLAPGERATVALIAADRQQARVLMRYVRGAFDASPVLRKLIVAETSTSLELANRVVIEVHTCSFRSTRGYSFAAVIGDETAFWRTDEGSATPDVEVLTALRPGLASIPGSPLICVSSPYARRGALWQAYREHYGRENDPVLVVRAPTVELNPTIDQRLVAAAYEVDPAAASAEYGGEFRTDVETFLSRDLLDAVVVLGRRELPPCTGIAYSGFLDPSGGAGDSFTLGIAHSDLRDGQLVAVLDLVAEQRPPFSPDRVVAEYASTLKAYGLAHALADRYAGAWVTEAFGKHGVHLEQAADPKSTIYGNLLPLVTSGRLELLDHPRLLAQLAGLERRTARGGKDSIDHAPVAGAHDDICNAAAGALTVAVAKAATTGEIRVGLKAPFAERLRDARWWGRERRAWERRAGELPDLDS